MKINYCYKYFIYKMTIFIGLKNIDNKKAQHPVGLFYIFDALVWLLSNLHVHCCHLLLLSGASCSLCAHDRQLLQVGIAAKGLNWCTPRRTRSRIYPKIYPQKLWIISEIWPLRNQGKLKFCSINNQNYWQKLPILLKKKATCF